MSLNGTLSFTPDNTTGDGLLTYKTSFGSLDFVTANWGKYITIPSEPLWKIQYASSWAKECRSEVIADIVAQRVPRDWQSSAIDIHGITFFDQNEDTRRTETGRQSSIAEQSPELSAFLHSLDFASSKLVDVSFFTFRVLTSADGKAEAVITGVFHGAGQIVGLPLRLSYFSDVPVFTNSQYFTRADTDEILEYLTKKSRWRYRLCIEMTEEQSELARKFFDALDRK